MKLLRHPEGIGFNGQILCGFVVTYIGPTGAFMKKLSCCSWSCSDCHKRLIEEHSEAIAHSLSPKVQVFVAHRKETGRVLSDFLRHAGHYCCIRNTDGATIISPRSFPGATRRDKKKFLDEDLPIIFDKPWSSGKRVTYSKDFKRTSSIKKDKPECYGYVLGKRVGEVTKLKNEKEMAMWLAGQEYKCVFKPGKEFIGRHVKEFPADASIVDTMTTCRPETIKELRYGEKV